MIGGVGNGRVRFKVVYETTKVSSNLMPISIGKTFVVCFVTQKLTAPLSGGNSLNEWLADGGEGVAMDGSRPIFFDGGAVHFCAVPFMLGETVLEVVGV